MTKLNTKKRTKARQRVVSQPLPSRPKVKDAEALLAAARADAEKFMRRELEAEKVPTGLLNFHMKRSWPE
jgi:hypothetical protein